MVVCTFKEVSGQERNVHGYKQSKVISREVVGKGRVGEEARGEFIPRIRSSETPHNILGIKNRMDTQQIDGRTESSADKANVKS